MPFRNTQHLQQTKRILFQKTGVLFQEESPQVNPYNPIQTNPFGYVVLSAILTQEMFNNIFCTGIMGDLTKGVKECALNLIEDQPYCGADSIRPGDILCYTTLPMYGGMEAKVIIADANPELIQASDLGHFDRPKHYALPVTVSHSRNAVLH